MEVTSQVEYPSSFPGRITTWIDIQILKIKYYAFLLKKCIRKKDFSYIGFIAKMNWALLLSRLAVHNVHPMVDRVLKLENPSERLRILLNTYIFFRIDDDKTDWEFDEGSPQERLNYIIARMDATKTSKWDTTRSIDYITAEALQLARKVGIEKEMRWCLLMIFESLVFDAKRIQNFRSSGKRSFVPRTTLVENYFRLDSLGTGQAMMLIFWDKPEKISPETINMCVDFSDAVRISYTLRDLIEDIRSGIVNIPEEDAQFFHISIDEIEELARHGDISRASENIKSWIQFELESAKALMENSIPVIENEELSELARMIMRSSYVGDFWRDIKAVEKKFSHFTINTNTTRPKTIAYPDGIKMLLEIFFTYRNEIGLKIFESKKFFTKCHNLFLMYLEFAKNPTKEETSWAAISAFLSAYYDWVTDGSRISREAQSKFLEILWKLSTKSRLNSLIKDMLEKDITKTLDNDWLERGSASFVFILEMMWLRNKYEQKCDIWEVWRMLQVIDDIDDYEKDRANWDWNVFCTEQVQFYYERMEVCFPDNGVSIFPGKILPWFIWRMRKKAKKILPT